MVDDNQVLAALKGLPAAQVAGSARFDPGTGELTDHRTYPLPPAQPGERAPARSAAATD